MIIFGSFSIFHWHVFAKTCVITYVPFNFPPYNSWTTKKNMALLLICKMKHVSFHQSHGKPQVGNSHVRRRCSSLWPVGGSGATRDNHRLYMSRWCSNMYEKNKRWSIEWSHYKSFSMLPKNPVLVNLIQQKTNKNTALSNISMLPYIITHHLKRSEPLGRRIRWKVV